MKTLGFASIPAVRQYVRFAQDQQLDVAAALLAAQIDPDLLKQTEARISGEQFQAFIHHLLQQSGDPLFGLKSSEYVQPGSYSVLGYIVMSCATLGEAIERIQPYEKLVGDMGITTLEPEGDCILVRWHCAYPQPQVRAQMIDNVLASWVTYARWLCHDPGATPIEIRFEHSLRQPEHRAHYERLFGCPLKFDQPQSAILISPEHMELPLRQPDQALRRTLEDHAQSQILTLADTDANLVIRVRNTIRHLLRAGVSNMDLVAEKLHITPRTLQRRLKQQGLSYQQLRDEIRLELAEDYLLNTNLSIAEIATLLGFAEPRSFHRSFKGWTGLPPGDYRSSGATQLQKSAGQK